MFKKFIRDCRNKGKFVNNVFMQYLMVVAKYIFPMLTFPYLTRVLEPDVYGIITYLTSVCGYFQIIIDFGFDLSSTKEIALYQNEKNKLNRIFSDTIYARLLLAIVSLILFIITTNIIPMLKDNIVLSYFYFGSVVISILIPDFLYRGLEKMSVITYRYIIAKTISTILTFIVVKNKADAIWVPVLNIIGTSFAILFTWFNIYKVLKIKLLIFNMQASVNKIKDSFVFFVSTFSTTAFGALNVLLLGVMQLPAYDIAYWGVSYNLISSAMSLYSPIVNSLYPHMVVKRDFAFIKKILCIFMPAIFFTVSILLIFSSKVILLFGGKEYLDATIIFRILLPVLVFSFPAQVLGFPVLSIIGNVKDATTTTVISAIFHVLGLFTLIFIGKFSIINVAILRSLTEFVLLISRVYFLRKYTRAQ